MAELVSVYFEPDWCAVYVDGELYQDMHDYEEMSMVLDAINEHNITKAERRMYDVPREEWEGVPETLEELDEKYDN